MERETPVASLKEERETGTRHGRIGAEGVCGKRVLPVGFLSLSLCLRKTLMKKAVRKKNKKENMNASKSFPTASNLGK